MRRRLANVGIATAAYLGVQFSMREYQRRINGLEPSHLRRHFEINPRAPGTARGDTTSRWLARSLTQGLGSCRSPNNPRHSDSESRHSGSSEASAPADATLAVTATELAEGAC